MREDMIAELDSLLEKARSVERYEEGYGTPKDLDDAYKSYDTAYEDFTKKWCAQGNS